MPGTADLTTIAAVRQFMQKRVSDTTQDRDLEVLITQASETIQGYCNREFAPAAPATRSFELEPVSSELQLLDVTPYEIRAITGVVLDPDTENPVTLAADQYRLWPYPARDGTFFGIRMTHLPAPVFRVQQPNVPALPFQTRRVDITGEWGMEAVPGAVTHYTNITVESWIHLRRDPGVAPGEPNEPKMRADDLPPAARWGLRRRWMRPTPSA